MFPRTKKQSMSARPFPYAPRASRPAALQDRSGTQWGDTASSQVSPMNSSAIVKASYTFEASARPYLTKGVLLLYR